MTDPVEGQVEPAGESASGFDPGGYLAELREAPTDALEHAYQQLDLLESGVAAHKLLVLSVLDEREVGRADGAFDTADWVARTSRLARARAAALVDTARQLRERPELAKVAVTGRLSAEQLAPAVEVSTPESDAEWAEAAPGMSPSALRAAARRERRVSNAEAVATLNRRHVRCTVRPHLGTGRLTAELAFDDFARVQTALERIAGGYGPGPDGLWSPLETRMADALVELASTRLAEDGDADRACIYLHVTEGALTTGGDGPAELADVDMPVAKETARRISCDATVRTIVEDGEGIPLRMGRRQRTVPPHIWRLLKRRDRHCQFPGCTRTRGLHAHHVVHFADGGATDLDNLILLCTRHHRFLHEGQWTIRPGPRWGQWEFHDPDGRPLRIEPPPPAPTITEMLQPA